LGAITATAIAMESKNEILGFILGGLAIILAMINLVGGFTVTEKMLKKFSRGKHNE
jgi:NAD(P) transhydrogenase subunit alpha